MVWLIPDLYPYLSVYNARGQLQRTFLAFPDAFAGGVNVAVGDIDQNGLVEIYAVPQGDGGPQIRIFNSVGTAIGGFFGFTSTHRLGASVAIWSL